MAITTCPFHIPLPSPSNITAKRCPRPEISILPPHGTMRNILFTAKRITRAGIVPLTVVLVITFRGPPLPHPTITWPLPPLHPSWSQHLQESILIPPFLLQLSSPTRPQHGLSTRALTTAPQLRVATAAWRTTATRL